MLKVLVIDDSKTIHNFVSKYLTEADPAACVESSMDGQAAVDRFRAEPASRFDVIFLDWDMPRLDGPHTLEKLRELGVRTPVIMLTSHNDVDDIGRMLEAGVEEYVMKPFTADLLIEKTEVVLGRSVHGG